MLEHLLRPDDALTKTAHLVISVTHCASNIKYPLRFVRQFCGKLLISVSTLTRESLMSSSMTVTAIGNLPRGSPIWNLEARLALYDIAERGFANEIRCLHMTPGQRSEAIRRRVQILRERESVLQKLRALESTISLSRSNASSSERCSPIDLHTIQEPGGP